MNRNYRSKPVCSAALLMTLAIVFVSEAGVPKTFGGTPTTGYLSIVPVDPMGTAPDPYPAGTVINGNTIHLPRGATKVWFDMYMGWAPDAISIVQITIDASGFSSGAGDPLIMPATAACSDDGMCEAAVGPYSHCVSPPGRCRTAWLDLDRSWVGSNVAIPFSFGNDDPNLLVTWYPAFPGPDYEDPGEPVLTGSFVLEVPFGASGTYTIGPDLSVPNGPTYLASQEAGVTYQFAEVTPAVIIVDDPAPVAPFARYVPVDPQGLDAAPYPAGTVIDGDTIYISTGPMRLWFDLEIGGWAPYVVNTGQVKVDQAGLSTGSGDPLGVADVACGADENCASAVGPGAVCGAAEPGICEALYFDQDRSSLPPLIVYANQTVLAAGFAKLPGGSGVSDEGDPYLFGTLVVDVPAGAVGTYSIDIDPGEGTFLIADSGEIEWADLLSAHIVVAPGCCLGGGFCADRTPDECTASGGTPVTTCVSDCNGNGRDDACETFIDCNNNGLTDSCDLDNGTDTDCDANGTLDSCDVAAGAADCNGNARPDTCDLGSNDCNDNGLPDDCDTAGGMDDCDGNGVPDVCDLSGGVALDCNANGVLDSCDIADATSPDVDGNCIPDECDQNPPPLAEPIARTKARFISFQPVNAGCDVAVRIRLVSLTPPGVDDKFAVFENKYRWLGPPTEYADINFQGNYYNTLSLLQCDPHFADWGPIGVLHAYGPEIMPESVYEVQFYHGDCGDVNDPGCYSPPLTVETGRWGDVDPPFADAPDPGFQPDFRDIAAILRKIGVGSDPSKVMADLDGNLLNVDFWIDFKDSLQCVFAFEGRPYPYDGPTACP